MEFAQTTAVVAWALPYLGALLSLALSKLGRVRDYIAASTLGLSAISATLLAREVFSGHGGLVTWSVDWVPGMGVSLGVYVDTLSGAMALIIAWLCFLIGVYSLEYMAHDPGRTRYWFFFDFFVGSMLLLVMADNLLIMFLGWEGTGLASYALIGHWYTDEQGRWVGDPGRTALGVPMWFPPSHSGLRALTFTRLGDVGFLLGIGVLYSLTGTFSIPEIAHSSGTWAAWLAARGLLLPFLLAFSLGAMAKSAQFPFHEWLVTAMTGPTSVSALIHAATMVKAGVYFLLRFAPIFKLAEHQLMHTLPAGAEAIHAYFTFITLIGAFTAFFMATQALVARELKLILAFSTASQLGYMFMALGSAGLMEELANGILAGFSHFMSHAIFKAALFLGAGAIIHAVHSKYVDDMGGLAGHMRYTFAAMLVTALSLAGVPPLMGFWSKDSVVEAAYESGVGLAFALGVVTAGLTAFYSTRLVLRTFFYEGSENVRHLEAEHRLHEAHPLMLAPYFLLAVATLLLGLTWPAVGPEILSKVASNVLALEEAPHVEVHLNPFLLGVSLPLVFGGIGIGWFAYQTSSGRRLLVAIRQSEPLSAIQDFLYDRWYINSIYYRVIVGGFAWLSRNGFRWFDSLVIDGFYHRLLPQSTWEASAIGWRFEKGVVDRGYHERLVSAVLGVGRTLRRSQTGLINHYLLMFFAGLAALILAFLVWVV